MKAIVLSAGQGRRLLPLTEEIPKCLLPMGAGETILSLQLGALVRCGIDRATVMLGFAAERVERHLAEHPVPGLVVETLYNPFYKSADNLATCWLGRGLMNDDFVLLNGDTLFEDAVLEHLLTAPPAPITVTIDHKAGYDDDDMKVSLDDEGRLLAIGKSMPLPMVSGESIGLISFRESGPKLFVEALEQAIRHPQALNAWYLSVIDGLAQRVPVDTFSIRGLWWREVDSPDDLSATRAEYVSRP